MRKSKKLKGILINDSVGLDPVSFPLLYGFPHCPEAVAVLAASSPTVELKTVPRDSKSEAAGHQGFLAKVLVLAVSKLELQNHFRTFPAEVEFSRLSSGH